MPATRLFHGRRKPGQPRSELSALFLFLWLLPADAQLAEPTPEARLTYSASSPAWLQMVGRLDVPGFKYEQGRRVHHRENCSATLVSRQGTREAQHIVTAWHCLEYYRDLSMRITFSLPNLNPQPEVREARALVDGGSMNADWAILRLVEPVAFSPSSAVTIGPANNAAASSALVMAGYSRDDGLGRSGQALTYHENCRQLDDVQRASAHTNCQAYKGASGGPVVRYHADGAVYLAGVISEGNGEGTSTFVPIARFRTFLNNYLR
jgi:V8-like Glu-specific endopeptidase